MHRLNQVQTPLQKFKTKPRINKWLKKKNRTQILKTVTELIKKYFCPKWRYSYLSAMESESWKEPDVREEQERKAKDQVEVVDLMIPFFHRLDSYFHGYLVCLVILLLQENHSLSPCKTQDLCLITLGFCQETWKASMYHLDSRPAPYFGTPKMSFQRFLRREKYTYVLLCFWNENKHTELQISLSRPCGFIFIFPAGVRIDRQIQVDKHTWIYKKKQRSIHETQIHIYI